MLSKEQTEQIKKQLIEQINSTFPEDKKQDAIQNIQLMNDKELEEFLMRNNLIKQENSQQCIFCSIVENKTLSYKIGESASALAVLEINPLSKGHTIVIPKPHVQEVSEKIKEFAKQISSSLKDKLNAIDIRTRESEIFGHKIINLIPIYKDEKPKEKGQQIPKEELERLQKELFMQKQEPKEKAVKEKKEPLITDKNYWLPKRIP